MIAPVLQGAVRIDPRMPVDRQEPSGSQNVLVLEPPLDCPWGGPHRLRLKDAGAPSKPPIPRASTQYLPGMTGVWQATSMYV